MLLELDDTVVKSTGLTPEELRLALAVQLYEQGKITVGQGGRITGLGHIGFQRELGKRQVAVHFTTDDLAQDLETLRRQFP